MSLEPALLLSAKTKRQQDAVKVRNIFRICRSWGSVQASSITSRKNETSKAQNDSATASLNVNFRPGVLQ